MKEQTANKTQYTFEEVIAIPYVQESIDSLIHISLKEYPRGCFNCSENVSQAQNGCKLVKNAHRFVKLRKYL